MKNVSQNICMLLDITEYKALIEGQKISDAEVKKEMVIRLGDKQVDMTFAEFIEKVEL